MRFLFIATVALSLAISSTACRKQEPAPAAVAVAPEAPPDANAPRPAHGPGTIASAPETVVIPESADVNSTLHDLSLELRKSVVRTRKVPKSFEEFIAQSNVQPPPPPAGKKYAIEGQAIVLVNR